MNINEKLKGNPDFFIESGIARQKKLYSDSQRQTSQVFGFKWEQTNSYESQVFKDATKKWLEERYLIPGINLSDLIYGKRILDAGCGSGFTASLLFGEALNQCEYVGVDISTAVDIAKKRFESNKIKAQLIQASIQDLPSEIGTFDIIYSEGVLHHTDSTEASLKYLIKILNNNGLIMFYVYRKKGPVREYLDDYIRNKISKMESKKAWEMLMPLTSLGKTLGDLNIEIDIKEPIEILGIPAGKIDIQRFFYWHILKAYYRHDWNLEEMNHVNFDWYTPENCHRHTPEEIYRWITDSNLEIIHQNIQDSGITLIAKKNN